MRVITICKKCRFLQDIQPDSGELYSCKMMDKEVEFDKDEFIKQELPEKCLFYMEQFVTVQGA